MPGAGLSQPDECPLCGGPNDCELALGKRRCWCFDIEISAHTLRRVPEQARDRVCICRRCATGRRDPGELAALMKSLGKDR